MQFSVPIPCMIAAAALGAASTSWASVAVEFRPVDPIVNVGDSADVGLFLVSETGSDIAVSALELAFAWDETVLQLDGATAAVPLLQSGFPTMLDGDLNEASIPADGDGFYLAVANLGSPVFATDTGFLLTTFEFTALAESAGTDITPLASAGSPVVETRVFDGVTPNTVITGSLIAGTVTVVPAPSAVALGLVASVAVSRRRRV